MAKSWDSSEPWYTACVGEKGHYYHQTVVMPKSLKLIGKVSSLLDLGCGQGVLSRHLSDEIEYCGVDFSKALVDSAKKLSKGKKFLVGDVTDQIPVEKTDFDMATFILSLQNMENGQGAIETAARHIRKKGKLLIVLNHPCFRIPRQSSWGVDEKMKLQYRRLNTYMSEQKIPIQTNPGKGQGSESTFSYHHPLSDYMLWLKKAGFTITNLQEWCSDKKSEGAKAKMEDRARKEFPLFLAIVATKEG
ncbi:MAG: SAM-dependent methyltransferase [Chlamydiae bacterium CG10_big_fil_rev_8_21_14_0_10_42_34]|nr:MAG: SAM-dependent methyltransferase [Chlamydiae bacterium CG10_big_fil_rev_8_21_14_0_10_42_34]